MTKKLLSLLLAVMMVFSLASPAMALELNPENELEVGEQIVVPTEKAEEETAVPAAVAPLATSTKPTKNITDKVVNKIDNIKAVFTSSKTGYHNYSNQTKNTELPAYTIGEITEVGSDDPYYGQSDWKTSVTFHFKSGDAFELAMRAKINDVYGDDEVPSGDWSYYFTDEKPADQTINFYWHSGYWYYPNKGVLTFNSSRRINLNNPSRINVVFSDLMPGVDMRLPEDMDSTFYVTYDDGKDGELFYSYKVSAKSGDPTPAFEGDLNSSENWKFIGWNPAVADTVTADVTYTAQWEACQKYKITFDANGGKFDSVYGDSLSSTWILPGEEVNLNTALNSTGNYKKWGGFVRGLSSDYSTAYTLAGWNTQADGKGTHYDLNGDFAMPENDVTLYAEWEEYEWTHWVVTFGEGGESVSHGVSALSSATVDETESFKIYCQSNGAIPVGNVAPMTANAKRGFEFEGWYVDNQKVFDHAKLTMDDLRSLGNLKHSESGKILEARFAPLAKGNVHVVIYDSADLTKPVKNVSAESYVGETLTLDINDYYSSAFGFEYIGWLNDGSFNQYKAGAAYTPVTEVEVTGNWQNVIAVVTNYEKVIVKSVVNGDKENAEVIFDGKALKGSNLVEFLEANVEIDEETGWAVDRWYNWDWYGHKVADNATVNGWTNVYVTIDQVEYTVSFDTNGAAAQDPVTRVYGEKYGKEFKSIPSLNGFWSDGWYLVDEDGNVTDTKITNTSTVSLTRDHTVFAMRKAYKPNVKISVAASDGGPIFNSRGVSIVFTGSFEKYDNYYNYTYQWYKDGEALADGDLYSGATTAVLTLKHDNVAASGTYKLVVTATVKDTCPIVVSERTNSGEGTAKLNIRKTANTLVLDANGGKDSDDNTTYTSSTNGLTITVRYDGRFTRKGYEFAGWNTEKDGTGTSYQNGDTVTFTGTETEIENGGLKVTLYAQWDKVWTVTYNDGNNGKTFATQTYVVKDGEPVPAFVGTPSREGYVFATWNNKYKEVLEPTSEIVTKDRIFSARWTAMPKALDAATVNTQTRLRTTDMNAKSATLDIFTTKLVAGTYTVGESYYDATQRAMIATVTVNKADFDKYASDLEKVNGDSYNFKKLGAYAEADANGNLVLHFANRAYWSGSASKSNLQLKFGSWLMDYNYYPGSSRPQLLFVRELTVTYKDYDGSLIKSFAVEENAATPTVADPTRTGYTFSGWTPAPAKTVTANVTYTATYNANTYTVSFNTNGGAAKAPVTVTYDAKYGSQFKSIPSLNGFWSDGWYLVDEDGNVTDTKITNTTVVTTARDHTVFAMRKAYKPNVKVSVAAADGGPIFNSRGVAMIFTGSFEKYDDYYDYTYQWYKDGEALADGDLYSGATTAVLTLKHDNVAASGTYKLVVTATVKANCPVVVSERTNSGEGTAKLNIRKTANTLILEGNGGVTEQGYTTNNTSTNGNDIIIRSQPFTNEGSHFTGWNTKKDGTGTSYKTGDTVAFIGTETELENGGLKVTLYAQWEACDGHLEFVKTIDEPTCTEVGHDLYKCSDCNTEYVEEVAALGHNLSGWIHNREQHWHKCFRCGELLDVADHSFTEWDSVYGEKNKEERHCTVCSYSEVAETIKIDANGNKKPAVEENPNTGAAVPSVLPALAVLVGAAIILGKKK